MERMHSTMEDKSEALDPALQKSVKRLSNRLASYWHMPIDQKDMLRMETFAKQPGMPEFVISVLQQHGEFWEEFDTVASSYDVIGWWYCIALLIHSETGQATRFLEELLDDMLRVTHPDLSSYRRLLVATQYGHVDHLKQKIRDYFAGVLPDMGAYVWAREAGIELPETEWQIRAYLPAVFDTKGRKYEITMTLWSPKGNLGTYWIEFSMSPPEPKPLDRANSIWTERDVKKGERLFIHDLRKTVPLATRPEPVNFGQLLDELEDRYAITFDRVPHRIQTNVDNSRKLIRQWFKGLADRPRTAPPPSGILACLRRFGASFKKR